MHFSTLFLHWGPGAHAGIERNLLPLVHPTLPWHLTDFWDQPSSVVSSAHPFQALVESAHTRLVELSKNSPVQLIAHSTGGLIAAHLAAREPSRISRITLLGSSVSPPQAFLRLGTRMGVKQELLEAAKNGLNHETFWPLVNAIASVPNFVHDYYWAIGSGQVRARYFVEAERHPPLNMEVFASVMNDLLASPSMTAPSTFQGPVDVLFGDVDPLTDAAQDALDWKRIFPQANSRTIPHCGHFMLFEANPVDW